MNADQNGAWQSLLDAGLVSGAETAAAELESPWYVRVMLGVAGWIAALFLLGFVAAGMTWLIRSEAAMLVTGLITLGVAWLMLSKFSKQDFTTQFALAVSFAGQALFTFGLFGSFSMGQGYSIAWFIMTLVQAALALLMPNTIHRLWSAMSAAAAFYMLLYSFQLVSIAPAIVLATAAWAWLNEFSWPRQGGIVRPIAYGLLIALVLMDIAGGTFQMLGELSWQREAPALVAPWLGDLLTGVVLLWVVWTLLRRGQNAFSMPQTVSVLAAAVLLVSVSFKAPGLPVGVCIIVLGYAHGNRILTGLGIAALLLYASSYYYTMDATLLVKSQVLAASGVVLLLARWLMLRVLFKTPEPADA